MNSYKGGSAAPPQPIVSGLFAGIVGTLVTYWSLPSTTNSSSDETILLLFKSMAFPALLFFNETHQCVNYRQTLSAKASYSPAGAEAAGLTPFEIVESNRIHRNHLESFAYFFPAALVLAAFCSEETTLYDARLMPAMVMNWTIGRFLYRFGYKSKNPYRRLFGMTYSMAVCVPAIPYGLYKFVAEVMLQK